MADGLIVQLNGIAAVDGGYQPVRFAGRIEHDRSAWVYASDAAMGVDAAFAVDAVVTRADGSVGTAGARRSPMMDALLAIHRHPVLAEAYRVLGSKQRPSWVEFYKVYELLRQECGGDPGLTSRTGVAKKRIELLTKNSNHQLLTGDEARHATMRGIPPPEHKITIDEGRAIVGELLRGFSRSVGGT